MSPCSLRMPMVIAPNLGALATQLSLNGLEEIWSPYSSYTIWKLTRAVFEGDASAIPLKRVLPKSQFCIVRVGGPKGQRSIRSAAGILAIDLQPLTMVLENKRLLISIND